LHSIRGFVIKRSNVTRAKWLTAVLLFVSAASAAEPVLEQLRIVAPAAPGGGWDQTARVMQQVLQRAGIVTTPVVENIAGAAGTIGLAHFIGAERGHGDAVLVSGLIMVGGVITQDAPITLADVVPIARLTGEFEVLTVPTASPFATLADFLRAFKEDPESISWGGGSAGGSDHILAGLIAAAAGVDPRRVNYIAFSGGGEALSAVLGGQVSVGINGLAEFAAQIEANTVRVLAISSAERLPDLAVPTLREQGIDIEFENWRSIVAPPGIDAAERARLDLLVEAMVKSPEWHEMLERFRWLDRYLGGEEFATFAASEERRVRNILGELGTAEYGDTFQPYPLFVLIGLAVLGFATAISLARGRRALAIEAHPFAWRSIALIGAGALLNVLLAERAGFIVSAALLFWFVARAFDIRHPLRDATYGLAVSVFAYVLFTYVLKLPLPTGSLGHWL
jgi:putative tricarboxylic transport membrane protein